MSVEHGIHGRYKWVIDTTDPTAYYWRVSDEGGEIAYGCDSLKIMAHLYIWHTILRG